MNCNVIRFPDGAAIVCGRGQRSEKCWVSHCAGFAQRWCDFCIADGKTCSRGICIRHATNIGEDLDLCPEHAMKEQRHGT